MRAKVVLLSLSASIAFASASTARADDLEARVAKLEDDKKSAVLVSGLVATDWTVFRQSSQDEVSSDGQPLNQDRFLLRRARLRSEVDRGLWHAAVELDANTINGPQVRPWNAEASVKWPAERPYPGPTVDLRTLPDVPYVIVSAGLLLTPFGFEVPEIDRRRPWLERSTMSDALFPDSFDLGFRVLGGYKVVNWALGIMNGDPIGNRTFPGRDPNKSKDLVFRLGGSGTVFEGVRLAGGVSGLTGRGFHVGQAATKDQLVWRDQNEDGIVQVPELQVIPGSPASPSETFQRFAVGGDARLEIDLPVIGTLALRTEIVRAKNLDRGLVVADPVAASRDLREAGWYVGATQEITRWAIAGVRYDVYDPDSDAQDQRPFAVVPKDTSFKTWSFMAAGRWPGVGRLIAQYDHRRNALGRDVAGAPTTLADDSLTIRAEVIF